MCVCISKIGNPLNPPKTVDSCMEPMGLGAPQFCDTRLHLLSYRHLWLQNAVKMTLTIPTRKESIRLFIDVELNNLRRQCETWNFCESGVSWHLSTSLALGSSSHPSKPAFCCQGSWWHMAVLQEPARVHNVFSTTLLGWPNPNNELTRCMLKGWLQSAVSLGNWIWVEKRALRISPYFQIFSLN